jgi:tetratricopeptide (TPR) repeat protein
LRQFQARSAAENSPKPSAFSQETEDPLAPLLQQAKDAMDKMDFAAALDPLQKYIAQRPDDPYAHFQLGYSYAGLKRMDDAKTEFSRAIALDPKMAAAHLNLGLVLMDSDPASAAAEAFRHAAELQPTESRPRFLAGFSLEHAGKFPKPWSNIAPRWRFRPKGLRGSFRAGPRLAAYRRRARGRRAIPRRPSRHSRRFRAGAPGPRQRPAGGKKDMRPQAMLLDEYLKLNPGDRAAHFDRASALFDLNRYDDALAELDRADAGRTYGGTLKMRGDIYMQQKKWKEAGEF